MSGEAWLVAGFVGLFSALFLALIGHRKLLPWLVISHTRKTMGLHDFREPSVDDGAGSHDIHYLVTAFDCRNEDLVIEGKAPRALYWQLGVYDPWLRAISGGHINHRTAKLDGAGNFRIRVSARAQPGPNTLLCADSPRGVLILRTLLASERVAIPKIHEEPAIDPHNARAMDIELATMIGDAGQSSLRGVQLTAYRGSPGNSQEEGRT